MTREIGGGEKERKEPLMKLKSHVWQRKRSHSSSGNVALKTYQKLGQSVASFSRACYRGKSEGRNDGV